MDRLTWVSAMSAELATLDYQGQRICRMSRSNNTNRFALLVLCICCLPCLAAVPKLDVRAMVDALANRNPTPKHEGSRHTPIFDPKFNWEEDARAWKALGVAIKHAEEIWPELVAHIDDERYCVTYKSFSGFTYDYTVGKACRTIILRNLGYGYFKTVTPTRKQPYLVLETPHFLRDPKVLKSWCAERADKQLYELQIEICEGTAKDLAKPDSRAKADQETKQKWIAAIERAAAGLRKSKKAVLWPGFGAEEIMPYTKDRADGATEAEDDPFK
jgi:hypothetical protein